MLGISSGKLLMPCAVLTSVCAIFVAVLSSTRIAAAQGSADSFRSIEQRSTGRLVPVPVAEQRSRVALVIGNSDYRRLGKLKNASADARDLCEALKRLEYKTTCLYDIPSRRAFREAVQDFFSNLNRRDSVVFYYAGHGVQVENENYLLPTNVEPYSAADIEEEGLSLTYLKRHIELAGSGPNLVILDACSDQPFPNFNRKLKGLARAEPPFDTLLVYATAPNEKAIDEVDKSKNGLFAKHLLAHVEKAGVTVEQLMSMVAEGVEKDARRINFRQVPFRSSSLTERFCLAACEDDSVAARALLEQLNELKSKDAQHKTEMQKLRAEVDAMREAIRVKEEQRRSDGVALQKRIAERDQDILLLQERVAALQRDRVSESDRSSDIKRLQSQIESLEHIREGEVSRLRQLEQERAKERNDVMSRETELVRLRQEIERYRQQVADLQEKMRSMSVRSGAPVERAPKAIIPSF
jgi:uncharacterized caspase-like protein